MPTTELVVARQPIFDASLDVMGFELLYRSVDVAPRSLSGDQMTAHVLLGAHSIGIDNLVGDKIMFCNADRGVLVGEIEISLPPEQTVIEVLETVTVDAEVLAGCRQLVEAGYRLALDDFRWFEGAEQLLALASIVKLDVLNTDRDELCSLVERCRPFAVQLLAEKVETEDDIDFCRQLGFELFQGYVLQRPQPVIGAEVVSSQLGRLELSATVLSRDLELDQFQRILEHEPGLVVALVRLASLGNQHGIRRPVRTTRDALILLGTKRLRRWVSLLLMRDSANIAPDAMATALVRARMCELLAERRRIAPGEQAFVAALISCIDILTGISAAQVRDLGIDPLLWSAAFDPGTGLGALVAEVAEYQLCCGRRVLGPALKPSDLDLVAAEALSWALPYVSSLEPQAA
ncbi:MAG TPA: EAL domain-containing protein [Jatrophihabitans sp.]|nr:EAL domain-containing protein [Jatrophihabitans sp.]